MSVSSKLEGCWPNTFICLYPGFINRAVLWGLADAKQLLQGLPSPSNFYSCVLEQSRSPVLSCYRLYLSPSAPLQLRNFRCGEVEFVSQVGPQLRLLCLNVEEVEQEALSYLNNERIRRTSSHCQVGATAWHLSRWERHYGNTGIGSFFSSPLQWEHGPVSTGWWVQSRSCCNLWKSWMVIPDHCRQWYWVTFWERDVQYFLHGSGCFGPRAHNVCILCGSIY